MKVIGHSLSDILEIIRKNLKINVKVQYMPPRVFDVPVNDLDSLRCKMEIDWIPQIDLVVGMRRVGSYLKDSLDGR